MRENKTITRAVEALYSLCEALNPGDTLTHQAVLDATGLLPHVGSHGRTLHRLRARMQRERGITLWSEKGVGYRLLTADETIEDFPRWQGKRIVRLCFRTKRGVQAVPEKGLSLRQREKRQAQLQSLDRASKAIRDEQRLQLTLCRPSAVHPKPLRTTPRPHLAADAATA